MNTKKVKYQVIQVVTAEDIELYTAAGWEPFAQFMITIQKPLDPKPVTVACTSLRKAVEISEEEHQKALDTVSKYEAQRAGKMFG
jgi:hypothetical protein